MSEKRAIAEIVDAVRILRDEKGMKVIPCDTLIAYLDDVMKSPTDELDEFQKEKYKAEWQHWVEQNKAAETYRLEMVRSVLNAGQGALRSAFLMSSGAVVALLAFIGKLSEEHLNQVPVFAKSMSCFVAGVFVIGLAYGGTYLTQYCVVVEKGWANKLALWLNISVILLVMVNYGLFVWGAMIAYNAFLNFN